MEDPDEDSPEYGLTELSTLSGVSARTIRYYQSIDVLPRPDRRGRQAVYGDDHLDRLRLIAELQDRGLTLGAISQFLGQRASPGISVGDWLGLDESLRGPWSEDRPRVLSDDELGDELGERPTGLRSRLERAGFIERQPEGWWLIRSPALLDLALQLSDAGIDIDVTGRATDLLRRRMSRAVDDLIDLFVERAGSGFPGQAAGPELETALGSLRPIAREAAGIILAHEIERGLRELFDAGPSAMRKHGSSRKNRRHR
ncbi:MAG: MerR family transcriptional regulator [Acidimicrobiales bacterium]|nr:MerR family transcriptional regulator [Acidimicrobiales bacterium]